MLSQLNVRRAVISVAAVIEKGLFNGNVLQVETQKGSSPRTSARRFIDRGSPSLQGGGHLHSFHAANAADGGFLDAPDGRPELQRPLASKAVVVVDEHVPEHVRPTGEDGPGDLQLVGGPA